MPPTIHVPVLSDEVLQWLAPRPGQLFVDGTLGGGGHTRLIAERVAPDGSVIAIDRDPQALANSAESLRELPVKFVCGNYADIPRLIRDMNIDRVDGVLLDLGLSSDQLADRQWGFSYDAEGPLDLRFNPEEGEPAWQWLQHLGEKELADIIYQFGEERFSRRIARNIVERRRIEPIRTAAQLAELVRRCVPRSRHHAIDPATRTFQALRIAINDELDSLDRALKDLPECLRAGGKLAIISFHSLEDRRVKHAFREDPRLLVLTKKPIRPNEAEVFRNSRSRSARLRVAERASEELHG